MILWYIYAGEYMETMAAPDGTESSEITNRLFGRSYVGRRVLNVSETLWGNEIAENAMILFAFRVGIFFYFL